MLYETPHVRVTADDGVGTVWLAFPGSPVNALCPSRVKELSRALDAVLDDPHLDAVVIRSGLPAGFCGGYTPGIVEGLISDDDAAEFANAGQRVFARLAAADVVSVAYIEGACVGPGVELALACDHRLAVAGPDSAFGFPDAAGGVPPCWGGPTRLRRIAGREMTAALLGGRTSLTAREALRTGLIDHAFCQRRGKIELRSWLDAVQARPRKSRHNNDPGSDEVEGGHATERLTFRHAVRELTPIGRAPVPSVLPLPGVVAVEPAHVDLAVEAALRGSRAVVLAPTHRSTDVDGRLAAAVRRGRATPLEADQARGRVTYRDDPPAAGADLVVADARTAAALRVKPSAIVASPNGPPADRPRSVATHFSDPTTAELRPAASTCPDVVATLAAWLPSLGVRTTVVPPAAVQTTHRVAA